MTIGVVIPVIISIGLINGDTASAAMLRNIVISGKCLRMVKFAVSITALNHTKIEVLSHVPYAVIQKPE